MKTLLTILALALLASLGFSAEYVERNRLADIHATVTFGKETIG